MLSSYSVQATNTGFLLFFFSKKYSKLQLNQQDDIIQDAVTFHQLKPAPHTAFAQVDQMQCPIGSRFIDGSDAFPLFLSKQTCYYGAGLFCCITQILWQGHQLLHWQCMLLMDEKLRHKLTHPTFSYGLLFLVHKSCCLNSII